MNERLPEQLVWVDMLQKFNSNPTFWDDVTIANAKLDLEADPAKYTPAEVSTVEQQIVQEFRSEHNLPQYVGRTAILVLAHENDNGQLGVEKIEAKFVDIAPEACAKNDGDQSSTEYQSTHKALVLHFEAEQNNHTINLGKHHILDFKMQLPEVNKEPQEPVNMLEDFFGDKNIQEMLNEVENSINFAEDDETRSEYISDYLAELGDEGFMPAGFFDEGLFNVEGVVYVESDEYEPAMPSYGSFENLVSYGFDVQHLDGKWRVVIVLEIEPSEDQAGEPDATTVYVVPSSQYVTKLERVGLDYSEGIYDAENDSLITQFHNICAESTRVINSQPFRRANIKRQIRWLQEEVINDTQGIIDMITPAPDEDYNPCFTCQAEKFWAIPYELTDDYSPSDIAKLPPVVNMEQPIFINGDIVVVDIPELYERNSRFRRPRDFPLSEGKPMLIIDDNNARMTYFVPLESVQLLVPHTINE